MTMTKTEKIAATDEMVLRLRLSYLKYKIKMNREEKLQITTDFCQIQYMLLNNAAVHRYVFKVLTYIYVS